MMEVCQLVPNRFESSSFVYPLMRPVTTFPTSPISLHQVQVLCEPGTGTTIAVAEQRLQVKVTKHKT